MDDYCEMCGDERPCECDSYYDNLDVECDDSQAEGERHDGSYQRASIACATGKCGAKYGMRRGVVMALNRERGRAPVA